MEASQAWVSTDDAISLDYSPPIRMPEYNAGVAAQYKHRSGFFGRIGYSAFGEIFFDPVKTSVKQTAYGLLSAPFGLTANGSRAPATYFESQWPR